VLIIQQHIATGSRRDLDNVVRRQRWQPARRAIAAVAAVLCLAGTLIEPVRARLSTTSLELLFC
jgi:hypothetical protein